MILLYTLLILLVNLCCFTIRWSQFGAVFSLIVIFNKYIQHLFSINEIHCLNPTVTRSKLIISSYALLWCLIYMFILPVHFLYPVSTTKFPNTLFVATSVIGLNLSCITLLVQDWRQKPLSSCFQVTIPSSVTFSKFKQESKLDTHRVKKHHIFHRG
uniref:Uncharacterized protein n=1 Tax=Cacopsylla melanoneura TaxID=428564 RepID=A0A8D9AMF8_9HEMI